MPYIENEKSAKRYSLKKYICTRNLPSTITIMLYIISMQMHLFLLLVFITYYIKLYY